jgi:hypothetical protein
VLEVVVGSAKSITAIGAFAAVPLRENSMYSKSWSATHGGDAAGVALSVGGASTLNTDAVNGCVVIL